MWRHPSDQAKALQGKGLVWLKQGARVLSPQRLVGEAPVLCNGNNHNLHFRAISCQPEAGTLGGHLLPSSWGSSPDAPSSRTPQSKVVHSPAAPRCHTDPTAGSTIQLLSHFPYLTWRQVILQGRATSRHLLSTAEPPHTQS